MKSSITKTIPFNMFLQLSLFLLTISSSSEDSSFECGNDNRWITYRDEKCLQVIRNMSTRDEAINACQDQDTRSQSFLPSLVTINSKQEQEFLEHYLFNELGIEDNVWIGAKRVNNSFVWDDDSDIRYSNWAQNKPSDDLSKRCAQMQSKESSNSGQWIDSSCDRWGLVVCEKLQIWTVPSLQKAFLESRRFNSEKYEDLLGELRDRDNKIASLEKNLEETRHKLSNFSSEVIIAVNNSFSYLVNDNENIREELRIKNTQIVAIIKDIDHLKANSSNNNSSQIESLRQELVALINSKINELSPNLGNVVTDVRLEIINYRRTLQIKRNGQWISIGYV